MANTVEVERCQGMDVGEIQELIDFREIIEDLIGINSVRHWGKRCKAMWENKLTLDNFTEGFRLLETNFDFFYDMDPLMIQALELKQMGEGVIGTK